MKTDIKISPILLENPKKIYHENIIRARFYHLISSVNLLAIATISISILVVFSSISSSANGFLLISVLLPILAVSHKIISDKSKKHKNISLLYKTIQDELLIFKNKSDSEIKKLFRENKLTFTHRSEHIDLAICRVLAYNRLTKKAEKSISDLENIQSDDGKLNLRIIKQIHDIYEKEILYYKLKSAEALHLARNPTYQKKLEDIGKIFFYRFSQRMGSILSGTDLFFVFNKKDNKYLSFNQIDYLSIEDISKIIFQ